MSAVWRSLANVVVGVHYAFLLYLITGGLLAWRWPKTIVTHALAAVWAVLIVTTSVPCPLTFLQNECREQAGLPRLDGGFIQLYVRGTFYPADGQAAAQAIVGLVVLTSWAGFAARRRKHALAALAAPVQT